MMETERLILRAWKETDAESLYKYAKDSLVGPIAGWHPHTSVENSNEIIRDILSAPETYAVVLKETNEPIGSVGIMFTDGVHSADIQEGDAEIGYWIGVPYWGKGLIPEAVKLLLKRCFEELNIKRVWAGHYDGNTKSRRVMEKCGFKYHHSEKNKVSPLGDIRTEHFTLITKEEWKKAQTNFYFDCWIEDFKIRLISLFGDRIKLFGIQGSYGRNEQTSESDIDVVIILDKLSFDDLQKYRNMIDSLPERNKICGFTSGVSELYGWEKSDLIQLYLDTKPILGAFDSFNISFSDDDIKRAVLTGACNIYHIASHNFLHAKDDETIKALYKTARFVVRMKYYYDTGNYISSMKELYGLTDGSDHNIIGSYLELYDNNMNNIEFEVLSKRLIEWSRNIIRTYRL